MVAATRPGHRELHQADLPPARDEWHDHARAQTERPEHPGSLLLAEHGHERGLRRVADRWLLDPGEHCRKRARIGPQAPQLAGALPLRRVGVRHGEADHRMIVLQQVDDAPVAERRHRQPCHGGERGAVIQGRDEGVTRRGEQAEHLLRPPALGDVGRDADCSDHPLVMVAQRGSRGEEPALRVALRPTEGAERPRDGPPLQRRLEAEISSTERAVLAVGSVEARGELRKRGEWIIGPEAEKASASGVGPHEPGVGVHDPHGVRDLLEDEVEAGALLLRRGMELRMLERHRGLRGHLVEGLEVFRKRAPPPPNGQHRAQDPRSGAERIRHEPHGV